MDTLYESDCTNVYEASGDGYQTQADACANCVTPGAYMAQNYNFGGACSPFTDTTSGMISQVTDGTYGFVSDGTNWYYEQPQTGSDQADPKTACGMPFNQYIGNNLQQVGTCQTEGFSLFGLSADKSIAISILVLIVVIAIAMLVMKRN